MFPIHAKCVTFDAGYAMERERARKELELGRVYTVQHMQVNQSSTSLSFWEIRGSFGSEFFVAVDEFGHEYRPVNEAGEIVTDPYGDWDDEDEVPATSEDSQVTA